MPLLYTLYSVFIYMCYLLLDGKLVQIGVVITRILQIHQI